MVEARASVDAILKEMLEITLREGVLNEIWKLLETNEKLQSGLLERIAAQKAENRRMEDIRSASHRLERLARKKLAEENWNLRRIDNEIVKVIEKLNVWHPYSGKLATEDEINWKVKEVLEHIALEKEIDSMEMDEEDVEFEDWELSENEEAAMAELEKTVHEELAITKNALLADEDIEMVDQFQCKEVEGMEYEEWLRKETERAGH